MALVVIEKVKGPEQFDGCGEEGPLFLEWPELGVSMREAVTREKRKADCRQSAMSNE